MTSYAAPSRDHQDPPRPALVERARAVLPYLLLGGTALAMIGTCAAPLGNGDTYFHLRLGQEFLDGWSLRHPGSVTTFGTRPWVPTQWLPEMVMAQAQRWGGLPAVAWLSGLQQALLLFTVYVCSRRWAAPIVVMPLVLLAMLALNPWLSMRPQVLSYALAVLTVQAWLRTREDGRLRWWLVPLTWIWAMVHGMWPVALVTGSVAVVGLALDRAVPRRTLARGAGLVVASAVAAALTPVGPALYPAVFAVTSRAHFFSEWNPEDFTSSYGLPLAVLLVGALAVVAKRRDTSWFLLGQVALALAWAGYSSRTAAVAAVVLVPLVAQAVGGLVGPGTPTAALVLREPSRRETAWVAGGLATCLAALAVAVPFTADEPVGDPPAVSRYLDALPAGTKVLNDWDFGGYLMWAHPQLDLMMNGYGDLFTTAELQRNTDLLQLDPGWQAEVTRSQVTYAVLRPGTRLQLGLVHDLHWHVVATSPAVEVLAAPGVAD